MPVEGIGGLGTTGIGDSMPTQGPGWWRRIRFSVRLSGNHSVSPPDSRRDSGQPPARTLAVSWSRAE